MSIAEQCNRLQKAIELAAVLRKGGFTAESIRNAPVTEASVVVASSATWAMVVKIMENQEKSDDELVAAGVRRLTAQWDTAQAGKR